MRGFPPAKPTRRFKVFNTYYPAQGEPVPTLQYEALREGIDDVRYLRLAHDLMARLEDAEAAKRSVAEAALKRILDPFFYRSVPTAGHFEWARGSLVALIAFLRGDTEELRLPELRPTLTRDKRFAAGRPVGGTCAEAWIQEGDAANRSGGNWFSVGALAEGARRRALIRFELPAVPPQTKIDKATLSLYAYGVSRPKAPHDTKMAVHRVLVSWTVTECTWLERSKGVAWSQPGASGPAEDIAPQSEGEADTVGLYLPMTFDVTESVRAWYRDPDSNHGLLVKLVTEDGTQYRNAHIFASSCTTTASHFRCWPSLTVETE